MPHPDTLCREEVESAKGRFEAVDTGGCAPAVLAKRGGTSSPDDIDAVAAKIAFDFYPGPTSLAEAITAALRAERQAQRERDAKIVLDWQGQLVRGELIDWHAERVAAAIRNGREA